MGEQPAVRVRSGLAINLPRGWSVTEALEARSPYGTALAVFSYPVGSDERPHALAEQDVVPGAARIGDPEPAQLFGELDGVVQRYRSESPEFGFEQLAAYAVRGGRAFVARATVSNNAREGAETDLRTLLGWITADGANAESRRRVRDDASAFAKYVAGCNGIVAFPEFDQSGDESEPVRTPVANALGERMKHDAGPITLSAGELHAIAHLLGWPAFPTVGFVATPDTVDAIELSTRSVLLARGITQFDGPHDLRLSPRIADFAAVVFHAQTMVELLVEQPIGWSLHTVWLGEGAVHMEALPGGVYSCTELAPDRALTSLSKLARVGTDPSTAGDDVATSNTESQLPQRRVHLRVSKVRTGVVSINSLEWVVRRDGTTWLSADGSTWQPADVVDVRSALATAVAAVAPNAAMAD